MCTKFLLLDVLQTYREHTVNVLTGVKPDLLSNFICFYHTNPAILSFHFVKRPIGKMILDDMARKCDNLLFIFNLIA